MATYAVSRLTSIEPYVGFAKEFSLKREWVVSNAHLNEW